MHHKTKSVHNKQKDMQNVINHLKTNEDHITYYNGMQMDYLMDPADNFLPKRYRQFLTKCIHSLKIQIFIACVIVFNDIVAEDISDNFNFYDKYIKWITDIIFVHSFIGLWILSVNRCAFKQITKTFEFWIKIYYALVSVIAGIGYKEMQPKESDNILLLQICQDIRYYAGELLTIVFISVFDGIQTKHKYKIIISGLAGLYWIARSIHYQFFLQDNHIVHISDTIHISFVAWQANAWRILGLFFLKQCIWNILGKTRATLINIKPNLLWVDPEQACQKTVTIDNDKNVSKTDELKNNVSIQVVSVKDMKRQDDSNRNSFSCSTHELSRTSITTQRETSKICC